MMKTVTCSKCSVQMHVQLYHEAEKMMMIKFVSWQRLLYSKLQRPRPMVSTLFRDPQALSSALASFGMLQPWAFGSLNRVETLDAIA